MRIIYIEVNAQKMKIVVGNMPDLHLQTLGTRFTPLMFHLDRNNNLLYLKEVLAARHPSLDRDSTLDCKGLHEFCMGKVS